MTAPPDAPPPARPRRVGPRGVEGLLGWSFFDPANLVCVSLLGIAALLTVFAMRDRGAPDWYMPLGLYACIAIFLRGYFFNYYHGGSFGRVTVLIVLLLGLSASALLWEDRAAPFETLRGGRVISLPEAQGFHVAALLHIVSAFTLFAHAVLPRRWLVRATDELGALGATEISALGHTEPRPPTEPDDAPPAPEQPSSEPPSSGR